MKKLPLLFLFVLLLPLSHPQVQSLPQPHIGPFFARIDDGPGFFVECTNVDAHNVSSGSPVWPLRTGMVRVDGNPIDFGNIAGPGMITEVAPGEAWRGILVFRQSETRYFPAVKFGAMVRVTLVQPLAPGKHTISVRCQGEWSDDFEFYWDPEAHQE